MLPEQIHKKMFSEPPTDGPLTGLVQQTVQIVARFASTI
jgi:hypothetical protein